MRTVLTIAGFDPSSGAGVTADLMVFAAHGLFGTSCVTALTVQSTLGVKRVAAVPSEVVGETLACLQADIVPAGIKIGMLGTSDNVRVVCEYLETLGKNPDSEFVPVVLDPVIQSSSGARLLDEPGVDLLRQRLLGLVNWVTPNIQELAMLTGHAVTIEEEVPAACRYLQRLAPGSRLGVLAKGGHLATPNDFLLEPDGEGTWIHGERVETRSTHGTGCALSSAFLSRLVQGEDAATAATLAKDYVEEALRTATPIGKGAGPMNHLWPILKVSDAD